MCWLALREKHHATGVGRPQEGRMKSPGGSEPPAECTCKSHSGSWLLARYPAQRDIKGAALAWLVANHHTLGSLPAALCLKLGTADFF